MAFGVKKARRISPGVALRRLPLGMQVALIAVVGLFLCGVLSIAGSAMLVRNMEAAMVDAARQDAQTAVERACDEISAILAQAPPDQPLERAINHPRIVQLLEMISTEEGTIITAEITDLNGRTVAKRFCEAKAARDGSVATIRTTTRVFEVGNPQDNLIALEGQPIHRGDQIVGQLRLGISPHLAMGSVKSLSQQISTSLMGMAFTVSGILLCSVVLVYYTVKRQTHLLNEEVETEHNREIAAIASGLAHEIRNPLHAMNLHLESAKEDLEDVSSRSGECVESARHALEVVQGQIARLNSTLTNFLSLSIPCKMEKHCMRLEQAVREVQALLAPQLQQRQIDLEVLLPAEEQLHVQGDQRAVHQALLNIVLNAQHAVEKRETRRIRVTAKRERRHVVLTVEDSGPGIPDGQEEAILKGFVSKRCGGTGIGLSIARKVMEGHGGSIRAGRSTDLGGALFTLEFPAKSTGMSQDAVKVAEV